MCGFGVEIRHDGPADREALERMGAVLEPRGPDGSGLWTDGGAGMVHRRLAIIDLSQLGAQPMRDGDTTIVFNGCIYNHHELRAELTGLGHEFKSTSDTEVLLKGWAQWGEDMPNHLKGMFAFVLREGSGRTVLVRDRLGVKPLYLAEVGGALRAASTLPALVAGGGIDTRVDPVALHHYLSWHSIVPGPRTILRGVQKLPPATLMVIEPDGRRRQHVYWDPPFERHLDVEDWPGAMREALQRAVKLRMVADVPVGILLSGGLDSSLIVALLAHEGQRGLTTFSIGFEDVGERSGDEFEFSDLVAREFETDHRQMRIDRHRLIDALPLAIEAMSEPMVSHDCVAFWLLSEAVRRERKVVQSGQGADEVLGGYSWYQPLLDAPGNGLDTYAASFFDRDDAGVRELLADRARRRRVARLRPRVVHAPGRGDARRPCAAPRHRGDAGRGPGQARRQHDDGPRPRGAHAVPRPRTGRAGRRLPARAQARARRQGRAQGGRARRRARRRHRSPEGVLPGARADAPRRPGARARRGGAALVRPRAVQA